MKIRYYNQHNLLTSLGTFYFRACFLLHALHLFALNPCAAQSPCAAAYFHDHFLGKNAGYRAAHDALETSIFHQTLEYTDRQSAIAPPPQATLTLPIVFHIVHQNGPENLTDAQVQTALGHLNAAFAHTGYFAQNGAGADVPIQFCLARQTPNKKPATGITRTVSPLTDMTLETQDLDLKNLIRWDPMRYINIWLVRSITSLNAGPGVSGYAFMPAAHGEDYDGIVMRASGLNIGAAQVSDLAHEMGHYLGLFHTFEGGCPNANCLSNGDRVCDTPPDKAASVPCPTNSCSTDADDTSVNNPFDQDVEDFGWNFMDYSPKSCYSGFTAGQGLRMRLVAEGARKSLLASKACEEPCDLPIALSLTGKNPTCNTLGSIQPNTTGPGPFDFRWSDGSTAPTLQNLAPGTYTLTLTNSVGCTRVESISLVRIAPTSVETEADSVRCHGASDGSIRIGTVQGGQPPFSYSVDNQSFNPNIIFENLAVGNYTVVVRDANGCTTSTTAQVHQPPMLSVDLTGDPVVTPGLPFLLTAQASHPSTALRHILWEPAALFSIPNSLQQTVTVSTPTHFRVTVSDWKNCTATDTLSVQTNDTRNVFFPNAISPGGSGQVENERFTGYGSKSVRQLRWLRVFDRWGNLVFERIGLPPNDPQAGWDGRFNGKIVAPGLYLWASEVEYADGLRQRFEGELSVVR